MMLQPKTTTEYNRAVRLNLDTWVPACGGQETAFLDKLGRRLLYVFNPFQHLHAYLDVESDMILSPSQANEV